MQLGSILRWIVSKVSFRQRLPALPPYQLLLSKKLPGHTLVGGNTGLGESSPHLIN